MNMEQLVHDLGIDQLPEADRQEMMVMIYDTLLTRMGARFIEDMNEAQLQRFDELREQNPELAIDELYKMFPNYEQMMSEEIAGLHDEVKALMPGGLDEQE